MLEKEYDSDKNTPLHYACAKNKLEEAKLLVEGRANVNHANHAGNSSLMLACMHEDGFPLIQLLVENKANVNAADRSNETPLMTAYMSSSYSEIFMYLLDRTDKKHINKVEWRSNSTLLDLVNEHEDLEALEAIKLRLKKLETQCANDNFLDDSTGLLNLSNFVSFKGITSTVVVLAVLAMLIQVVMNTHITPVFRK